MTEQQLIRRLDRLAREWPEGYMLASMGGSLHLFRADDRFYDGAREPGRDSAVGLDQEKSLWSDGCRIPNTGGDW
jgi:hypothetical protein